MALGLILTGCNFAIQTPTPIPPTLTPSLASTMTLPPTVTPTPTMTATPTITPSPTITLTPSATPFPTATAYPTVIFSNDQWTSVEVPAEIRAGLDRPWFAVLSVNERTDTTNLLTPVPSSDQETIYLVDPSSGQQIAILDLPASTEERVFWSPDGNKLAYFLEPGLLPDGTQSGGLYLLNLSVGISLRLFNIGTLNPRGYPDHRPVWSPDSSQLAIVLPTAYDTDIFLVSADGSMFQNITGHGAYDLWPAWSPDGRRLAFVSDRDDCPTWVPGESGSCSVLDAEPPAEGMLYVMDVATGQAQRVSDVVLDGPPVWVSNLQIAYTTGLSDPFAAQSRIWITDTVSGATREISDRDGALNLGSTWAPGGLAVLYHRASDPTSLVLKDGIGNLISSTDEFLFPRYGFSAAWSPQGEWVAIAGRNGQCPYGLIVARNDLSVFYGPATTPRVCDPSYSPDGRWLAFAGIQYRAGVDDGRLDLYIAEANGYGARNLTSRLRGEIRLLGWVGGGS